jgi:uncharacterized membrane protein
MQRLIYAVLALALAGGSVYLYLKNATAANRDAAAGPSAPKERIDRANKIARDIEQQAQQRADDAAKKTE